MNIEQAKIAYSKGKKIRHESCGTSGWVRKNGKTTALVSSGIPTVTEDIIDEGLVWRPWNAKEELKDGWSVIEELPMEIINKKFLINKIYTDGSYKTVSLTVTTSNRLNEDFHKEFVELVTKYVGK